MRMVDLIEIEKKKAGKELTKEEIHYIIDGYVKEEIPDYQMSAFMMAVYFQGMTSLETAHLTYAMMQSGDVLALSKIKGIKVSSIYQKSKALKSISILPAASVIKHP